jgi:hypothetical protein
VITVTLHQVGSASELRECASVDDASSIATTFQAERWMGASDMGRFHGEVRVDGKLAYRVSYNGSVRSAR